MLSFTGSAAQSHVAHNYYIATASLPDNNILALTHHNVVQQ